MLKREDGRENGLEASRYPLPAEAERLCGSPQNSAGHVHAHSVGREGEGVHLGTLIIGPDRHTV